MRALCCSSVLPRTTGLFRDVLDLIIEIFSSVETTMRLMQTDTFDEFLAVFMQEIS